MKKSNIKGWEKEALSKLNPIELRQIKTGSMEKESIDNIIDNYKYEYDLIKFAVGVGYMIKEAGEIENILERARNSKSREEATSIISNSLKSLNFSQDRIDNIFNYKRVNDILKSLPNSPSSTVAPPVATSTPTPPTPTTPVPPVDPANTPPVTTPEPTSKSDKVGGGMDDNTAKYGSSNPFFKLPDDQFKQEMERVEKSGLSGDKLKSYMMATYPFNAIPLFGTGLKKQNVIDSIKSVLGDKTDNLINDTRIQELLNKTFPTEVKREKKPSAKKSVEKPDGAPATPENNSMFAQFLKKPNVIKSQQIINSVAPEDNKKLQEHILKNIDQNSFIPYINSYILLAKTVFSLQKGNLEELRNNLRAISSYGVCSDYVESFLSSALPKYSRTVDKIINVSREKGSKAIDDIWGPVLNRIAMRISQGTAGITAPNDIMEALALPATAMAAWKKNLNKRVGGASELFKAISRINLLPTSIRKNDLLPMLKTNPDVGKALNLSSGLIGKAYQAYQDTIRDAGLPSGLNEKQFYNDLFDILSNPAALSNMQGMMGKAKDIGKSLVGLTGKALGKAKDIFVENMRPALSAGNNSIIKTGSVATDILLATLIVGYNGTNQQDSTG